MRWTDLGRRVRVARTEAGRPSRWGISTRLVRKPRLGLLCRRRPDQVAGAWTTHALGSASGTEEPLWKRPVSSGGGIAAKGKCGRPWERVQCWLRGRRRRWIAMCALRYLDDAIGSQVEQSVNGSTRTSCGQSHVSARTRGLTSLPPELCAGYPQLWIVHARRWSARSRLAARSPRAFARDRGLRRRGRVRENRWRKPSPPTPRGPRGRASRPASARPLQRGTTR